MKMVIGIFVAFLGALPLHELQANMKCNGSEGLCSRRYNAITQIMAHNATSTTQGKLLGLVTNPVADQHTSLQQQFDDGIRAFKLPIHAKDDGSLVVAHTVAKNEFDGYVTRLNLGIDAITSALKDAIRKDLWRVDATNIPFADVLAQIKGFLDTHPYEVVTLLLNVYVDTNNLTKPLSDAGISNYLHIQPLDKPWPTLGEMIAANKRLVIFTDVPVYNFEFPWVRGLHSTSDWVYRNTYTYKTLQELQMDSECNVGRAFERGQVAPKNTLFLFNHFVTPGIAGSAEEARIANSYDVVKNKIQACRAIPNFIHVDFYDEKQADLERIVRELNAQQR